MAGLPECVRPDCRLGHLPIVQEGNRVKARHPLEAPSRVELSGQLHRVAQRFDGEGQALGHSPDLGHQVGLVVGLPLEPEDHSVMLDGSNGNVMNSLGQLHQTVHTKPLIPLVQGVGDTALRVPLVLGLVEVQQVGMAVAHNGVALPGLRFPCAQQLRVLEVFEPLAS